MILTEGIDGVLSKPRFREKTPPLRTTELQSDSASITSVLIIADMYVLCSWLIQFG